MNPLKELLELAQKKEELDRETLNTVAKARADKHSWQAIANVLGGTKQAAQQKYGKAVEPLLVQGKYECSCGWTMVYPGWEGEEAADEIAEHRYMHMNEDERDDYGTEPAELEDAASQLAAEPSKIVDVPAPANVWTATPSIDAAAQLTEDEQLAGARAMADKILGEERAAKAAKKAATEDPTPRRTAAAPVKLDHDSESDMARVESGELDTAGNTIDWTGMKAGHCLYCEKTHHYSGKGRNLYFWIYPGCNPTHRDGTQHKG